MSIALRNFQNVKPNVPSLNKREPPLVDCLVYTVYTIYFFFSFTFFSLPFIYHWIIEAQKITIFSGIKTCFRIPENIEITVLSMSKRFSVEPVSLQFLVFACYGSMWTYLAKKYKLY